MEKNMNLNFEYLERRVKDALENTDLDKIRYELKRIKTPTLVTGVGGSNVVSEFTSRVLREKNGIIALNNEPRNLIYDSLNGFENVIACSYSGNNFGVDLAFRNDLKKYFQEEITKHKLEDKAYQNCRCLINKIFNYALDEEYIQINPMAGLVVSKSNIQKPKKKTKEEVVDLICNISYFIT